MEDKEVRIGVYICHCGSNIAGKVDIEEVVQFAQGLPSVVVAKDYVYMCSEPGQSMIKEDIKNLKLNRVVVASCSPTLHEPTFRRVCQEAGLNPYLFEQANIREQCSWVTEDGDMATDKAKALVSAGCGESITSSPWRPGKCQLILILWLLVVALPVSRRLWRLPMPTTRSI